MPTDRRVLSQPVPRPALVQNQDAIARAAGSWFGPANDLPVTAAVALDAAAHVSRRSDG